jgi:hypothetical protein
MRKPPLGYASSSLLSLVVSSLISVPVFGQDRAYVAVPVQKGESLSDVLKRIHPCEVKEDAKLVDEFLKKNPETLDLHGNFTLFHSVVQVPSSLLESGRQCARAQGNSEEGRSPASAHMNPMPPDIVKAESESGEREGEAAGAEHSAEHAKTQLKIGTFLEYSQLHSTDSRTGAETVLDSKPEYGVEAAAFRALSPRWLVGANYKFAKTAFNELEERELHESHSSLQEFSVGGAYRVSEESLFSLNVGYAQVDHLSILEDDVVQVDAVWTPKISALFEAELFRIGRVAFGAGMGAATFLPSSQSNMLGLGEQALIFGEAPICSHLVLGLEIVGAYQRQTFTNETHSLRSYGANLNVGAHF